MQEEIEIKVFLKNPEEVKATLKKLAKFIKEKTQKDEYFVPQHKDFFAQKPTREYLRVRSEDGKNNVGYHFCHLDKDGSLIKTDEYETTITNPEMMVVILKKLGMQHRVTVTKHRTYFEYKGFEVLVDHIEELGYFMEIEAKDARGTIKQTKETCYALLDEFGATWEKTPNQGYPDMLLARK
jgi:adenylate cyclase, class 2